MKTIPERREELAKVMHEAFRVWVAGKGVGPPPPAWDAESTFHKDAPRAMADAALAYMDVEHERDLAENDRVWQEAKHPDLVAAIQFQVRALNAEAGVTRLREAFKQIVQIGVVFDAKAISSKRVNDIARAALDPVPPPGAH